MRARRRAARGRWTHARRERRSPGPRPARGSRRPRQGSRAAWACLRSRTPKATHAGRARRRASHPGVERPLADPAGEEAPLLEQREPVEAVEREVVEQLCERVGLEHRAVAGGPDLLAPRVREALATASSATSAGSISPGAPGGALRIPRCAVVRREREAGRIGGPLRRAQAGGRRDRELGNPAREVSVEIEVARLRRSRRRRGGPGPRLRGTPSPRRIRPAPGRRPAGRAAAGRGSRSRWPGRRPRGGRARRGPRRRCGWWSRAAARPSWTRRSWTSAFSISVGWCTSEPA